jgi:hypothetical protein
MANFPEFIANSASVVPATSEVTYNKYWMRRLVINAPDPQKKTKIVAEFMPCRDITITSNVNGVVTSTSSTELMPNGKMSQLTIPDAFGLAAQDPNFANVMGAILTTALNIGVANGIFKK